MTDYPLYAENLRLEAEIEKWKRHFEHVAKDSLHRVDLLKKVVEAVEGRPVEENEYQEDDVPYMVRAALAEVKILAGGSQ
jgi:hypothetical protein